MQALALRVRRSARRACGAAGSSGRAVDGDDRARAVRARRISVVTANLAAAGGEWSRAAELSVYLKDDVTPASDGASKRMLAAGDGRRRRRVRVEGRRARRASSRPSPTSRRRVDGLGDNPLPASFEVRLQPRTRAAPASTRWRAASADCPASPTCATTGSGSTGCCRRSASSAGSAWCWASLLTLAAALTVANVVRLALYARRDEIEIMQLVGAPQAYIRGPFVMEGVLQGGLGALVALARWSRLPGAARPLPRAAGGGHQRVLDPVPAGRAVPAAGRRGDGWSAASGGLAGRGRPDLSVTES